MSKAGELLELAAKKAKDAGGWLSWDINSDPFIDAEGVERYGPDYALIEKVFVPEGERGKGHGRALIRQSLKEIQESHPGIDIKLAADPFGENAMDMDDLVKFYESEGFDAVGDAGSAVIMKHDGTIRGGGGKSTALGALGLLGGIRGNESQAATLGRDILSANSANKAWQGAQSPLWVHKLGRALYDIELPGGVRPLEGTGEYLMETGYQEPMKTKLKRAVKMGADYL